MSKNPKLLPLGLIRRAFPVTTNIDTGREPLAHKSAEVRDPRRSLLAIAALTTVWFIGPALAVGAPGDHRGNPSVVPINAHYAGLSYTEWSIRWWQWFWGTLTSESPALDSTGERIAEGQSGPVWFLIWQFSSDPMNEAVRTANIPEGLALLFPATNSDPWAFLPLDTALEERRAVAESIFDNTTERGAEVDGVPINDMDSYRVVTPPYMLTLPEGNLLGLAAGDYGPTISAGNYFLVKPLPVGKHTIHFFYTGSFYGSVQKNDYTYELTVCPHGKASD